jgi:hypothetical protein
MTKRRAPHFALTRVMTVYSDNADQAAMRFFKTGLRRVSSCSASSPPAS